jgi:hypothetical protein
MRAQSLVAALAIVAGCAPVRNYVYGPTPQTRRADPPGQIDGHAAATYRAPLDDPPGEVQLAAERLTTMKERDERGSRQVHVVVVRMVVHNRDHEVWSIDSGGLDAVLDGARHEYPIRADSNGKQVGVVVLEPGETRSLDLYYELPTKDARPTIAVEWRVQTPSASITRTTTALSRHDAAPPRASGSIVSEGR